MTRKAVRALRAFADVQLGRQRSPEYAEGPFMTPYLRAANVKDGSLDLSDVKEMNFTPAEREVFGLRRGDVFVSEGAGSLAAVGASAVWDGSVGGIVCFQNTLLRLRPRPSMATPRFLGWWARHAYASGLFASEAIGVNIFHLSADRIRALPASFPRIDAQERVADFLDRETARTDAVVGRKEHVIALIKERCRALIDSVTVPGQAVGSRDWPVLPLRKLAGPRGLFTDGDWIESPNITDDGIRLIQTGNIGVGSYREQGFRYISEDTFRGLRCTEVFPGDVLICRLADPVGRACLAPAMGVRMITSVDVCILRPAPWIDARFVVAYLSSSAHLSFLESIARGGTRDRVSRDQLGQVPVPVPPLEEQQRIAGRLERELKALDRLVSSSNQQIGLLREHRQALISAAVTGQLDVPGEAA